MTQKPPRHIEREFEFRATGEGGDGRTLEGYAAVFNSPTLIDSWEGKFTEIIQRGAFAKTISERWPIMQYDHGHDSRVGSIPIGAITDLREDDRGLFVRASLFDNPVVEPIRQAIAGGAISGMSFRFRVNRERWDKSTKPQTRYVGEVECPELGPVCFPAYADTSVGVRGDALERSRNTSAADREKQLREMQLHRMKLQLLTIGSGGLPLTPKRFNELKKKYGVPGSDDPMKNLAKFLKEHGRR